MDANERLTKLEEEVKTLREILKEVALCIQELAKDNAIESIQKVKTKIENIMEV